MGVAWTRTPTTRQVWVSMGACISEAARKAAQSYARMGLGSHDLVRAGPGSPGDSKKKPKFTRAAGAGSRGSMQRNAQSQQQPCQCTHLVAIQPVYMLQ